MVTLNYRDGRPLYEQISASFRKAISAGLLQAGEKLPSVRELAGSLAINPNTIQRAYRMLEEEGWIVSVSGKGSFAAGVPQTEALRVKRLFTALLETAAALEEAGVSRETILEKLREGGKADAES